MRLDEDKLLFKTLLVNAGDSLNIVNEYVEKDFFKKDYETITVNLLYESVSYKDCRESLIRLKNFLN